MGYGQARAAAPIKPPMGRSTREEEDEAVAFSQERSAAESRNPLFEGLMVRLFDVCIVTVPATDVLVLRIRGARSLEQRMSEE